MFLLGSIFRAGGIIFLSLLLGAIALAYVGVQYPTTLKSMLSIASDFKEFLVANSGLEDRYNVWVQFLVKDEQFVFMFFVILMRLVLLLLVSLVSMLYHWLWDWPRRA